MIEPSTLVSAPAAGSPVDRASRIARKVVEDRMISTVDPQTRPTPKSTSVRKDGYRGHVTAEPETGLITDCEMTKAAGQAGSDSVVGEQMISRDRYHHADAHRWPAEHNEPARPERAHQPPGDDQPADQQNVLAEPVDDSPAAATDEGSEATGANTEPADRQHDSAEQGKGLEVLGRRRIHPRRLRHQ